VSPLRRADVGCATGVFRPRTDGTETSDGEGLYWRMEYAVMAAESRLGILAMASGTALAFRRSLFQPIPPDSDADVVIAPSILATGARVAFVPDAVVMDDGPHSLLGVLRARRRMTLRALPATVRLIPHLWRSGHRGAAVALVAHKLLRWATPIALVVWVVAAAALTLAGDVPIATISLVLLVGATGGLLAATIARSGVRGAIVSLGVAQLAFALAILDAARGRRAATWTREDA
jgi:cellulose synthase/poly-beta-1,6-N-acetylglucosamine synthase-like glycosyltransferase